MKKINWIFWVFAVTIFSGVANSVEVVRSVTISRVLGMGLDRPSNEPSQGFTRIYVNSSNWGDTSCRQDSADLHNDDQHLYSMFLAAWMSGKKITIGVEDSLRRIDTVCQITYMLAE